MTITILNNELQPLEIIYNGGETSRLQFAGNPASAINIEIIPDGQDVTNIEEYAKRVADAGRTDLK